MTSSTVKATAICVSRRTRADRIATLSVRVYADSAAGEARVSPDGCSRGSRRLEYGPGSLREHAVHEGNRDRTFSNSRCDALDVAGAHVADRKYARQARFQKKWRPRERPSGGLELVLRNVRSGLDEPIAVDRDASGQPDRIRHGAG